MLRRKEKKKEDENTLFWGFCSSKRRPMSKYDRYHNSVLRVRSLSFRLPSPLPLAVYFTYIFHSLSSSFFFPRFLLPLDTQLHENTHTHTCTLMYTHLISAFFTQKRK